jgi:hypothetical protein
MGNKNVSWIHLAQDRDQLLSYVQIPSHHLLNVLLQIANKLGLSNKKKKCEDGNKHKGSMKCHEFQN